MIIITNAKVYEYQLSSAYFLSCGIATGSKLFDWIINYAKYKEQLEFEIKLERIMLYKDSEYLIQD